jgi:DNA-binding SARP family transcriptional activator
MADGTPDDVFPVVRAKLRAPESSGLSRDRLIDALRPVWSGRLAVVTGPAGSGKTTLLAQYAASLDAPVAWLQAEAADGDPRRLLAHLYEGFAAALGPIGPPWEDVDSAVATLDGLDGRTTLVVIDDVHALEGTESEATLERLAWFAPPKVGMVVASRRQPGINLSRLRVADRLVEIDADGLRFRSWEVEQLFHDVYREPLPPEDLATLARRTEGWAAGLQLFHLATRGKPAGERRQMVRNLSSRFRLVRQYLTQNVIDELPAELGQFLLDTCVLGRLTGALCDEWLGRSGTAELLEEIERRQIFLCPVDGTGSFRYHEVLRSHLEACLVDRIGERQARDRYRRAGIMLEAAGARSEALRAYCRAGEERAVLRLLRHSGAEVADKTGNWTELLPAGLTDHDPWLVLAAARRHLAAGRWRLALETYQRLETSPVANGAVDKQRQERLTLTMWMEPVIPPSADWVGIVCQAARRDPVAARHAAASLPGPTGRLAAGLAALLAGQLQDARALLRQAGEDPDASPAVSAGGWLAAGIAGLLAGTTGAVSELHIGREQAEELNLTWLARVGSCAAQCLAAGAPAESETARIACQQADDGWGTALVGLLQGFGWAPDPASGRDRLMESAELFRLLGAGTLEAWARAGAALAAARAAQPDATQLVGSAETLARATATWGALLATFHARALTDPARAADYLALAGRLGADPVVQLAGDDPPPTEDVSAPAAVSLQVFGDFSLAASGVRVDLAAAKPRVRSLIRLLALHTERAVHREALIEALWPGSTLQTGTRNLQVAVSAARHLLERTMPEGAAVVREGDGYRLALPDGAEIDIHRFDEQLSRARRAREQGDLDVLRACLTGCLDLYRGEVLAVEGPAEWVQGVRERYRVMAADAAEELAEVQFAAGEDAEAARTCERGLAVDRYRDRLWRLRAEAHERAGDLAASTLARRNYAEMLRELGLAEGDPGGRLDVAS